MCGGSIISNPITQLVSDAIATATGNPELIPLINGGEELAGGGGLTNSLIDAGTSYGAQELSPVLTNATGLTDATTGAGNSLTDLFGQTVGAGSLTGPGTIGGDVSNGLSDLYNFSPSTGLSSLLGGTAAPSTSLNSLSQGIDSATPSANLATSAGTPSAPVSVGTGAGAAGGGGAGGGGIGGGVNLGSIGESSDLPSSTAIGGNLGGSGAVPISPDALSTGSSPALESSAFGTPQTLGATSQAGLPSVDISSSFNPSSLPATNLYTPSNTGLISSMLGTGNAASPITDTSLSGLPGISGTSIPLSASDDFGSGTSLANTGGSSMGILGSLFGGGSGATAGAATPSAGSNVLNGLLRGGLGYLLNSPNTAGANAINNATTAAQAQFAPYTAAGTNAENTLASLYGNNGGAAETAAQANFANTPGYQFALGQGENAVNASAAQNGNPLSGNTLEALNNYAQGTANSTYNNYVNQLQNLASGGLSAAGGTGTAGLTGAAAISQLDQNKANAANTAIGTGLSALFPSGINLQQLLSGGGGGGGLLSLFGGGS